MQKRLQKEPRSVVYCITKSNFGGAQKYLFDIARAAQHAGYTVHVLAGSGSGAPREALEELAEKLSAIGITTVGVPHMMREIHPLHDMRAVWEVYTYLKKNRPHVFHTMSSKAGIVGALAARMAGVPRIVFTAHGLVHEETWRSRFSRYVFLCVTWLTHVFAHTTIHITKDAIQKMQALPCIGAKTVTYVANGITKPSFISKKSAQKILALHDHTPNTLHIGTIAELTASKNILSLVDAVHILHRKNIPATCVIIGFTNDHALKELFSQKVRTCDLEKYITLTGPIPNAATLLQAFDVFVLPSHKEGLPYVLLEAGLAKVPIVASDIPAIRELLCGGAYGTLAAPTPEGLAEAILHTRATENTNTTARFAEHVCNHFSLENMCAKTLEVY